MHVLHTYKMCYMGRFFILQNDGSSEEPDQKKLDERECGVAGEKKRK